VPTVEAVAIVDDEVDDANVRELGPRTRDHRAVRAPFGSPSSKSEPLSVKGAPNRAVCGNGATTTGALFIVVDDTTVMELVVSE
jgi:hypothetical protein